MSNYKTETKCIQSGYEPGNGEARVLPIYQSTTFRYTSSEQMGRLFDLEESGYFYTRLQNPTNDAVAAKICDLEGGVAAMLTSSGQAANFYAIMNIVEAGDHIVCASAHCTASPLIKVCCSQLKLLYHCQTFHTTNVLIFFVKYCTKNISHFCKKSHLYFYKVFI